MNQARLILVAFCSMSVQTISIEETSPAISADANFSSPNKSDDQSISIDANHLTTIQSDYQSISIDPINEDPVDEMSRLLLTTEQSENLPLRDAYQLKRAALKQKELELKRGAYGRQLQLSIEGLAARKDLDLARIEYEKAQIDAAVTVDDIKRALISIENQRMLISRIIEARRSMLAGRRYLQF